MAKHTLVNQPTAAPTEKIKAAGLTGLAATLVLAGLDYLGTLDLPTVLDNALPLVSALVAGYFKREQSVNAG